jgi:hypothetical protein
MAAGQGPSDPLRAYVGGKPGAAQGAGAFVVENVKGATPNLQNNLTIEFK